MSSSRLAGCIVVLLLGGCAGAGAAGKGGAPELLKSDPALPSRRPAGVWGAMADALQARRALDDAAEVQALLAATEASPGGAVAAIALRRLSELAEESPERAAQVDEGVARVLAGGRLSALAAYRARVTRALVAEALGDPASAARHRAENGAVAAWTVLGPFSALRVLDFDAAIPPEAGPLPAEVPAPAGLPPARTRSIPTPDGTFALDGEPFTGDVFALVSDVGLTRGGRYLLALNTAAAVRVLVDGALVHERRAFAALLPGVVYLPIELRPGRHRLVVKLARTDGGGAISVSLARADGIASDAVWTAPGPGSAPPAATPGIAPADPVATARKLADALAKDAGPVLARLLAARDAMASDREGAKALLSEALSLAPGSASLLVAIADAREDDPTLDRRVALSRAEAALRDALRTDPAHAEARVLLARLLRATERLEAADEVLAALASPAAGRPQSLAARARVAEARGLPERAEALATEALTAGGSCDAAGLAASLAMRRQALPRIEETSRLLTRCRGGRERLGRQLRQRGDPAGARALLEPLAAARPWDLDLAIARAEALVAEGQARSAVQLLAALADWWPRSPRLQTTLAGALELAGDRAAARAARERALLLDGGDLALRRALALEDGREALDDLSADARTAIEAYEAAGRRNGVSAVMVLDSASVDIHPGGVATERTQQVIHVLDQAGVDQHGEVSLPAGAEVIVARTLKPDGRAIEPESSNDQKGTLSLSGLEPGDYVQLDYIRSVRAPFGALGYVADPFFFQAARERLFWSTYVVRAPAGAGLAADPHGMTAPGLRREGAFEVLRAERRDVPPFVPEPSGPGMGEVMPYLAVGTGGDRESLQRNVADRLVGRTLLTEELATLARSIRSESRDSRPMGLARAAYRRIALSVLGEGSLVEDASEVLSRGRGSRLLLLKAVLEALGLEARVALVRPFAADPSPHIFPTLGLYSAQVLRVRAGEEVVWLDPSTRLNPFGAVPSWLADCEALIVPEPGEAPTVDRTPNAAPDDGRVSELRIVLAADGAGELTGTDRYLGTVGAALKEQLEQLDETQRRQAVESVLTRSFRGVVVQGVTYEGEHDPDAPLVVRWRGTSPQVARPVDGGGLVLESGLLAAQLSARYVRLAGRTTPLLLGSADRSSTTIEIVPPVGAHVLPAPPARLQSPFGGYERSDRSTAGGGLARTERLDLLRARIPPDSYPAFVTFSAEVDALQGQSIRLPLDGRGGVAP